VSDWFHPYRYTDAELRTRPAFDNIGQLCRDLHAWRREHRCRAVHCTTVVAAWSNADGEGGEELVAVVKVVALPNAGADPVAERTVLTRGEEAEELLLALQNRQLLQEAA
jgi:hypothetical protein